MRPTSGFLIATLAKSLGIEKKTVSVYVRNLIEAEQLPSGARGVNAVCMTSFDVAVALISLLGTRHPTLAAEATTFFGSFTGRLGGPFVWELSDVLSSAEDHEYEVAVTRDGPSPCAQITFGNSVRTFYPDRPYVGKKLQFSRLAEEVTLFHDQIAEIGSAFPHEPAPST